METANTKSSRWRFLRKGILIFAVVFVFLAWFINGLSREIRRLNAGFAQITVGMPEADVMKLMGDDDPVRENWVRLGDRLLPQEQADSVSTLVFSNPYYLDPVVYCYFDRAGKLVAKRMYH